MRKIYSTDLSDRELVCLKTHLTASKLAGTMRAHPLRDIYHAIFCVLNSGCPRRLGTSLPLVNARGWGERPSSPIEESKDFWGSVRPRPASDIIVEVHPIPLPTLTYDASRPS